MSAEAGTTRATIVPCPRCRQPSRYASDNPWRPFCSETCRQIDLGAWAEGGYRLPARAPDPDAEGLSET